MTKEQVYIVKKTWKIIMCIDAEIIGDAFYSKLFSDHPTVRKLFPEDLQKQYVKLIEMLTYIVSRLERHEEVAAEIKAMAERHANYGVEPIHYEMVGATLIWTLQVALKTEWSPEVEKAWSDCYNLLAGAMLEPV